MNHQIKFFRRPYQIICLYKNKNKTFFIRTRNLERNFFSVKYSKNKNQIIKLSTPFEESIFTKYKNNTFLEIDKRGSKFLIRNFSGNIIKKIPINKKNLKIESCIYDYDSDNLILLESSFNQVLLFDFKFNKFKSIKFGKKIKLNDSCIEKFEKSFLISHNKNEIKLFDKSFKILKNFKINKNLRHIKSIKFNNEVFAFCDYLSHKIHFFNNKFKYINSFGGKGFGHSRLDLPNHLDVFKNNFIISDLNNDRVLELVTKKKTNILIKSKYLNNDFRRPIKILKKENYFYILDRDNNKICVLNKKLKFKFNIEIKSFNDAKPNSFTFGKFNEKECIVILYRFFNYKNKILIYNFSGKFITSIKIKTKDAQDINYLKRKFVIADTLNRGLNLYDNQFNLIKSKKITSITKNKRALVKFVEIDENNNIYTSDFDKCVILKFDENLNLIDKFNFQNLKENFSVIRSAYFYRNKIFIFSRNKYPLWVYDIKNKKFIDKIGSYKFLNKTIFLQNPTSLLIDGKYIYVVDKENDKIIKYKKEFYSRL